MILIVGLGNPGPEYKNTRHNVGFMVLDELAKDLGNTEFVNSPDFKALTSHTQHDGQKIVLIKPMTFMNLSGESVSLLANFYKIKTSNIIVIYDDIDLPIGSIRIRKNGGPGSHNGMKSVVEWIGKDFPRIRIGIESRGVTSPEKQLTKSFVLAPFSSDEKNSIEKGIERAIKAVKCLLEFDIESAMNQFNKATD